MKKVLALVLAVVMVVGMASVAAFAEDYETKSYATLQTLDSLEAAIYGQPGDKFVPGDTFTVKFRLSDKGKANKVDISDYSFKVSLDDEAEKQWSVVISDYTIKFTALGGATMKGKNNTITITVNYDDKKGTTGTEKIELVNYKSVATNIITEEQFQALKDQNKDQNIKAEMSVGDYITISDITTPRDVNYTMIEDTPSAIAEALDGKDYAYAGYKYLQPLPGVGTMKIDLSSDLLLTGAEKVYVYEVSGDTFKLVASSADDKMFEVEDGAVEFPVSRTSQYIITDKALSSTGTSSGSSSGSNNPGTGANDMVGAAVVMALVAGAGIVAFKK